MLFGKGKEPEKHDWPKILSDFEESEAGVEMDGARVKFHICKDKDGEPVAIVEASKGYVSALPQTASIPMRSFEEKMEL